MDVLGYVTDGSRELQELYDEFSHLLEGTCELHTISLESAAQQEELPYALVIPYRRTYDSNPAFRELTQRLVTRFGTEDAEDYRAYLFPTDMTGHAFLKLCDEDFQSAIHELGDVIQIQPDNRLSDIADDIKHYFKTWKAEHDRRHRTLARHALEYRVGWVASILTWLALAYTAVHWCTVDLKLAPLAVLTDVLARLPHQDILVTLTWFVCAPMLVAIVLSLFQKGLVSAFNELDQVGSYPLDGLLLGLCAVGAILQTMFLLQYGNRSIPLVIAGVLVGIALDYLRRLRYRGARFQRFRQLDKSMSTGTDQGRITRLLRNSGRRPITMALRRPLRRTGAAKIFVSYTHSSSWACSRVRELIDLCEEAGIDCFVDSSKIPRGASWRRCIFARLLESDYVIAFVDSRSVTKQWPAAELEMALALRSISGTPQPIAIVPAGFTRRINNDYLPVFRDTLLCSAEPDFFVRVIWYSPLALRTFVTKAIAHHEAKDPSALLVPRNPNHQEDRQRELEATKAYELMDALLAAVNRELWERDGARTHLTDAYGRYQTDPSDAQSLMAEFINNAGYAERMLMPQQAILFMREALELACLLGRPEVMAAEGRRLISTMYGSLLSDYTAYLDIHRIEYEVAFACEKLGDNDEALTYVERCLEGLDSIGMLLTYYGMGFSTEGELKGNLALRPGNVTVLPLGFKSLGFEDFSDLRSRAKALERRLLQRGLGGIMGWDTDTDADAGTNKRENKTYR